MRKILSVLDELLRLLNDGGLHSTAELARRLGVTEGLVSAMAADLARRGYLEPIETGCGTGCDGCGLAAACSPAQGDRRAPLLALTAKGRAAAQAQPPTGQGKAN
jgi:DNA-binding MarR family transcriptional regulator